MRSTREVFKNKLQDLINKNGLNQTTFAKNAGFLPSQVNRWIKGENEPGIDTIEKIASFFGLPAAALITEGPLPSVVTREPTAEEITERIKAALDAQKTLGAMDPEILEVISILSAVDKDQRFGVIFQIKSLLDTKIPRKKKAD